MIFPQSVIATPSQCKTNTVSPSAHQPISPPTNTILTASEDFYAETEREGMYRYILGVFHYQLDMTHKIKRKKNYRTEIFKGANSFHGVGYAYSIICAYMIGKVHSCKSILSTELNVCTGID